MKKKKKDDRKYFVVKVKENDEKILFQYDDEDIAKLQMTALGRKLKPEQGVVCVAKGYLDEDGHIDWRYRQDIAAYDRWLEKFLAE